MRADNAVLHSARCARAMVRMSATCCENLHTSAWCCSTSARVEICLLQGRVAAPHGALIPADTAGPAGSHPTSTRLTDDRTHTLSPAEEDRGGDRSRGGRTSWRRCSQSAFCCSCRARSRSYVLMSCTSMCRLSMPSPMRSSCFSRNGCVLSRSRAAVAASSCTCTATAALGRPGLLKRRRCASNRTCKPATAALRAAPAAPRALLWSL